VKRAVLVLALIPILMACSAPGGEFTGDGRVKGVFKTGIATLHDTAWVEMIRLDGPPKERCGPGECGAVVGVFRRGGTFWPPGRWRVIPPHVPGMTADPVVIVVEQGKVTTFELDYRQAG
jgi:hypothetical protein